MLSQLTLSCNQATGPIDLDSIRELFPSIKNNPETIFFDNSATTQKPSQVIETISSYYTEVCANSNRAAYSLANSLHNRVEEARYHVAKFINAETDDIAFTSGATNSLNLVATSWGLNNLTDGDEVMLCLEDHQSTILPWLNVRSYLERIGKTIKIVPFFMHSTGIYDWKDLEGKITSRTRLIVLTHIHNLYGLEFDAKDLAELKLLLPSNTLISLDASQSIGHTVVDAKTLDVDFISFSGHKMFAANGVGVLWTNPQIKSKLWPQSLGSKSPAKLAETGLIIDKTKLSGLVECGTLNLPAIFSMDSALSFIESIGMEKIEKHISMLTRALYQRLKAIPIIEFAPGVASYDCAKGFGIIAFRFNNVSSTDLAQYLDQEKIFVRSGDHCLVKKPNEERDYIRASLHLYNTEKEIDRFINCIEGALFDN